MPRIYDIDVDELLLQAEKQNCVEMFGELLFELYKVSRSNYDLRQILIDPKYDLKFRMECLEELFSGKKPPQLFLDFTALVLDNNLLGKLYSIYHQYLALMAEKYNLTIIQCITAIQMPDLKCRDLRMTLERQLKKKVILKNIIDKKILGGLVLKIPPDKIVDLSLRRKMIDLNQHIRNF